MLSYGFGYVLVYMDCCLYYGGGGDVELMIFGEGELFDGDFCEDFEVECVVFGGYGCIINLFYIGDVRINFFYDVFGL